jgi:hypothetical protein
MCLPCCFGSSVIVVCGPIFRTICNCDTDYCLAPFIVVSKNGTMGLRPFVPETIRGCPLLSQSAIKTDLMRPIGASNATPAVSHVFGVAPLTTVMVELGTGDRRYVTSREALGDARPRVSTKPSDGEQ